MTSMRVAVVMPPVVSMDHAAVLELWPTFTGQLEALRATQQVDVVGYCRTTADAGVVKRNGVDYYFENSNARLAKRVFDQHPRVVHVHGLGFTRLLLAIRRAVGSVGGRRVALVMQHHGEPPPQLLRSRLAQRATRTMVDGYLFTGADGQAAPFRRSGSISRSATVFELLESASDLGGTVPIAHPALSGSPSVLWVGRLIPSKDPLCAVRSIASARSLGSDAELHMVATDRSLEDEVLRLIDASQLHDAVHIHPPVAHADMAGWYAATDIYLSTSHREGSNYSLIEALGFGCVPVVTEIPSHAAIVKDLSRRFPVGDAGACGALIATPNKTSRSEIVSYAERCLSWETIAGQLVEIYRQL